MKGFTGVDRALLQRSARSLEAKAHPLADEIWDGSDASRARKLEYDRLMRDGRDLRALAKRLAGAPPAAPAPAGTGSES